MSWVTIHRKIQANNEETRKETRKCQVRSPSFYPILISFPPYDRHSLSFFSRTFFSPPPLLILFHGLFFIHSCSDWLLLTLLLLCQVAPFTVAPYLDSILFYLGPDLISLPTF
ncbi:hypothetical protein CPB86DRAFT_179705 [Serendipita vermifera]|nr:hypothetical protein CPB86DRAFT_179705 [Serendipita vermifera]